MVTSAAYNPLSPRNRGILHEMAQMPLEIGLHFDPSIYGVKPLEDLLPYVAEEAAVIQSITQRPIDSVSIHNPSVHNQYVLFPGYRNAYDPKIFNPELYLSDSRMVFSRDVIDFAERANTSAIQVLLHPLHFTEEGDAYPEIACRLVAQFANELDATFRVNSTYASLMPTDLLSMVRGNREFEGPE